MAVTKRGKFYHYAFQFNGVRYREATNATTKIEAQKIEAQAKASIIENRFERKQQKQITFSEFAKTFLEWSRENKKSFHTDENRIKFLLETFGNLTLDKINQFAIERFKRERLQTPTPRQTARKPATVNRDLHLISKILTLAVERGHLEKNPARLVKKLPEHNERYRYLTTEEETRLFETLEDLRFERFRPVVIVALQTGMRRGELLSLTWRDVDFKQKSIRISSENSKTSKTRFVPMNETCYLTLLDLSLSFERENVFGLKTIDKIWQTAIKLAKVEDFHFHDLRHTCATRLSALGADGFMIAEILGHSNLQTTKRYAHVGDERKRRMLENLVPQKRHK